MRRHEERVVRLEVKWNGGQHDARHSAHYKNKNESEDKMCRGGQTKASAPERRQPTKDLDAAGDRDHHACRGEVRIANLRQTGGKHVVHPQTECDESISYE